MIDNYIDKFLIKILGNFSVFSSISVQNSFLVSFVNPIIGFFQFQSVRKVRIPPDAV